MSRGRRGDGEKELARVELSPVAVVAFDGQAGPLGAQH
jgi:hypothetical protein